MIAQYIDLLHSLPEMFADKRSTGMLQHLGSGGGKEGEMSVHLYPHRERHAEARKPDKP